MDRWVVCQMKVRPVSAEVSTMNVEPVVGIPFEPHVCYTDFPVRWGIAAREIAHNLSDPCEGMVRPYVRGDCGLRPRWSTWTSDPCFSNTKKGNQHRVPVETVYTTAKNLHNQMCSGVQSDVQRCRTAREVYDETPPRVVAIFLRAWASPSRKPRRLAASAAATISTSCLCSRFRNRRLSSAVCFCRLVRASSRMSSFLAKKRRNCSWTC